jgi:hypothetical protein
MKKAPALVRKPMAIRIPPKNSENAAAPNQNHVGRMNEKGVLPDVNALKPGPPNVASTFCEPWAIIMAARLSRIGRVNHVGEVAINRLNIFYA